jgi:hypothetical protein
MAVHMVHVPISADLGVVVLARVILLQSGRSFQSSLAVCDGQLKRCQICVEVHLHSHSNTSLLLFVRVCKFFIPITWSVAHITHVIVIIERTECQIAQTLIFSYPRTVKPH